MGNTTLFIIALIVLVLFWGSERRVDERDYLIRTIAFEASGETEVGKVAVAHVISIGRSAADGVTISRLW